MEIEWAPTGAAGMMDQSSQQRQMRLTALMRSLPRGSETLKKYPADRDFELLDTLGKGTFATVRLARPRGLGMARAAKVVDLTLGTNARDHSHLEDEIKTLRRVEHPNICGLHDCYLVEGSLTMILDLCQGGELFDRIVQRVYYSEKEARDLVWVLLDVLHHIHGKRIAHRDLKPENLLLKSTHNDHDVKLADFGFATEVKKPLRELCGTPAYVAPEIIQEKPYGLEVDMWSCGVIVFILLGGYPPFDDADGVPAMYSQIKAGTYAFDDRYWASVSGEAKAFIKSLLQVDPSKRPSAAAAMNHDWFTKHAAEISATDLKDSVNNMKKWNARRKLKGGIKAVMAANRAGHAIDALKH
mmetsp:Transcript_20217/g.60289  ORF Transcript_20217/g.60289 Transcript_20217/m.60289 type:complete len:356 (+) Transcript_20217:588-1655(+)